tara:strand:- start:208 stop:369 length:162 start_codon:yes stop_codon:yes gene_type:complete
MNILFLFLGFGFIAWWLVFAIGHTRKLPFKLAKYLGMADLLELEEYKAEDYYG